MTTPKQKSPFQYVRRSGLAFLERAKATSFNNTKFLIIQFRQIGDVLLSLPLARAIKREVPQAPVYFLTEKAASPLVQGYPFIDEVMIRDTRAGFKGDLQLMKKIRALKFDVVIDGIKIPSSGWFSLLSGASLRIAMNHKIRKYFYSLTIVPQLECGYAIDEKLVLLKALGFAPYQGNFRSIELAVDPTARKSVTSFLRQNNLEQKHPLLVIAPTSKRPTRLWPAHHFSRLIDLIHEQRQSHAIIVWGPGEELVAQNVASACQSPFTVFFKSSLRELVALIARCDLLIGNDSAPRHIAVSQDVASVAIHGATGIGAWTPPVPEHIAFSAQAHCQPCNLRKCDTLECLIDLKPEMIIADTIKHLDEFGKRVNQ
ncbi:glycosyltransferase family 9 protein [candidate division CSSED10-310 bacterium]|uniref:Glycosyltransferase family 9 protein n=1 Tax=candidate division CSSED10-310 bacterium TaxID=2855610 RepID=A0ABV6YUT7_UNCC1